ncbi:MAG: zinc ribbon domain-containing protein [Candidatus Brennerbacteria bacterium]|nr:zinc ribbon domain-containing protein [Candidatus Brennerbacteria bacterium]
MALTKCGECGGEISDKAISCPHCGNPIRAEIKPKAIEVSVEPPQQDKEVAEAKPATSLKRLLKLAALSVGIFILLALASTLLMRIAPANAFFQKFLQFTQDIPSAVTKIVSGVFNNEQSISLPRGVSPSQQTPVVDPLAIQTNPDGSKIYPVQYNNLWGHEFYTSKIDQSGSIDIGSEPKQSIAKLLNSLGFPPTLTKNLIFVHIDPTIVKQTDRLKIPWAGGNVYVSLQPQGGTYQNVYGGSVIALNNLVGYNPPVLVHELGHLIGAQLTDEEWKQYYKLRGIPSDTQRNLSNWNLSPTEDFAEVYKNTYGFGDVQTQYGLLVETSWGDLMTPCSSIALDLQRAWLEKYGKKDKYGFMYETSEMDKAKAAIQSDPTLQACRAKNIQGRFGANYARQVNDSTKNFVRNIVARLNADR